MTNEVEFLIIGAGPTGLGAAWRLDQTGRENWRLCEADAGAGGLAGSVTDEHGFTWDLGGHVQFSHYPEFDRLMDELLGPDGWIHHERQAWIWTRGRFVPYPFQLNLHRLPDADRDACLAGLVTRPAADARPAHLGDWIDQSFGSGIASLFLRPYNLKVWAYPLEELSCAWTGDRVAAVDLERVRENIRLCRDDVQWGPNNRFRFPRNGGTGAIWRELARRLADRHPGRLCMGRPLLRLDTAHRRAHFPGGETVGYERLLTTAPLDRLVERSDLAVELGPVVARLRHSSTHVIGFGLHGQPDDRLAGKCWVYFPDGSSPFYRATVFSHYSPGNVPDPARYWSLLVEVSESPVKRADEASLVDGALGALLDSGFVAGREAVHHVWHRRLEHGYPTPTLDRDAALGRVLPALEARGVYSRGRFGAWKYEVSNQDHSFAQGVEAVNHWLDGTPEVTLHHPEIVNRR
jgi:protoporphyrinogen oxidase